MALTVADEPILATEDELPLLQALAARLDGAQTVTLLGPDDEPIALSASARQTLALLIQTLARGDAVAITPIAATLTAQQAADFLQLSRPALLALVESGEIAANPDPLRPVRLADVLAYRQRRSQYRRQLFAEMLRDAQEIGLYDLDYPPPTDDEQP